MMKKHFYVVLVLVIVIIGVALRSQSASAYYAKGSNGDWCYAIQYRGTVDRESAQISEGVQGALYSTKQICYDGKSIYNGGYPSNTTSPYSRPKFELVNDTTVRVIYCKKGDLFAHSLACRSNKPEFDLNAYGGDFKKMAQAIQSEIEANGALDTASRESIVGFSDNNATAEEGKEQYDKERAEDEKEYKSGSTCYDESGHLGWVFCPLIEGAARAMRNLYDEIVQPFLVIEPELVSGDGTYVAWDIFRNFANIAFVILFLVVIFSQLTGVGIDNYGIKRMLPKLIAAAILINLSYLICQLAVDLSNILGNSLESLFINIAEQVNARAASPAEYFSALVKTVGSAIGVTGLGGAALVSLAPLASMGLSFALIIPLLLGLLSAIIAVLFMFVILFVRKAIAILLVAVAPVAFVAYIMPNTKRLLFDKWLNIFKGVLAVYPLAGILVGGGVLASSIIVVAAGNQAASGDASLGTFLLYMGALLLQVVPFFFLPRLFRNSISAVGNLGDAIVNRGRRFSERARGAVENSERLQDWQNRQRRNAMAGRAQRTIDRLGSRPLSGMSGRDQRRLLRAQRSMSAYTAQEANDFNDLYAGMSREQLLADAGFNAETGEWGVVTWAGDRNADQRMSRLLSAMEARGMESDIYRTLRSNNVSGMTATMQTLAGSNNKILKAYGKTGNGVNYDDFMNGGMYRDANGRITNQAIGADGRANTAVSMQRYASEKGGEFVNGIDDKALAEINRVDNGGRGPEIMSSGQLTQAAANLNDEASMREINSMLNSRNDLDGVISGEQLAQFNASTLGELETRSHNDVDVKNAIIRASNAIAADPKLVASMNSANKATINSIRSTRGLSPIP